MLTKKSLIFSIGLCANIAYAADMIDLSQQPEHFNLSNKSLLKVSPNPANSSLKQVSTHTDFNQERHVRFQQMYMGIPVWGATPILHQGNQQEIDGVMYENLQQDLPEKIKTVFDDSHQKAALSVVRQDYQQRFQLAELTALEPLHTQQIIFIDDDSTAHFAFHIAFSNFDDPNKPHSANYIVDASQHQIYRFWDNMRFERSNIHVGGVGGNEKVGEIIYDGLPGHAPVLDVSEMSVGMFGGPAIHLFDEHIEVKDKSYLSFTDFVFFRHPKIPGMYWLSVDENGKRNRRDEMNGGYSPSLDVFYNTKMVYRFYQDWYKIAPLFEKDGKTPKRLTMMMHFGRSFDNAFWDPESEVMYFGDGGFLFYPLTSIDIVAHELAHGFTEQHAKLDGYYPQMAALHEAYSDATAVAVKYYLTGKADWELGKDVCKIESNLRNIANPTEHDKGIDHINQFQSYTEPHSGAGVFNKAFYLLANKEGWDVHKAFNLWIKANMDYWNSSMTTLQQAACGVYHAAEDYQYSVDDVYQSFIQVGLDTHQCQ
jgi:Zn-dependent metalloprotease